MAPYDVAMLVEFHAGARDVRMVLTMDAMHGQAWIRNMSTGWESELARIGRALEARAAKRR